jgi:L-ribulose-5-phosphate 3-epimerase
MKKSISIWSFPGGTEGAFDLTTAFKMAASARFQAVELAISAAGELTLETTRDEAFRLLDAASGAGVEISSVASGPTWEYLLTSNEEAVRRTATQIGARSLEIASWLGARAVLVLPGSVDGARYSDGEPVPYDLAYARLLAYLRELAPVAEGCRVNLAFENVWNKFLLSPLEVRQLIDAADSQYVGIHFDTGNVVHFGYPEQWIRILGPRVKGVHLKDFRATVGRYPEGVVDLLEGDVNWPEVTRALRETRYEGHVVAEAYPLYTHAWDVRLTQASLAMDRILGYA